MNLGHDTGRGLAEQVLAKDRDGTAASTLADVGANRGEVGGVGWDSRGVGTVKVGNAEDIGSAALRGAVEAAAGDVDGLAVLELGRGSEGDAGEEGDKGGGELHLVVCGLWRRFVLLS